MPKTIIAVVNARHRKDWRDAQRASWIPQVPRDKADVFFFVGRGEPLEDPEGVIELDCSDTYEQLPDKIRAICRWSVEHEYGHTLKTDDDVVLRPNELLASEYHMHDYSGRANRPPQPYVVPMGFNYWLSQKSTNIIAKSELPGDGSNDDEKWVARKLWENDIRLFDDRRYFLHQFRIALESPVTRPLRAPKRPPISTTGWGPGIYPGTFSWCVHIAAEQSTKIEEYEKVFERYGEK